MWIETIPFEDAEGQLRLVYDKQAEKLGQPTPLTMLGSLYPDLAVQRMELYDVVEDCPSTLSAVERQGVALAAVAVLQSEFLLDGVTSKFKAAGGTTAQAEALRQGHFDDLSPKAAALAHYTRLTAENPHSITINDVTDCRAAGATDLDILDANNLAAYYAYLARVCLGLGLRHDQPASGPDSADG